MDFKNNIKELVKANHSKVCDAFGIEPNTLFTGWMQNRVPQRMQKPKMQTRLRKILNVGADVELFEPIAKPEPIGEHLDD